MAGDRSQQVLSSPSTLDVFHDAVETFSATPSSTPHRDTYSALFDTPTPIRTRPLPVEVVQSRERVEEPLGRRRRGLTITPVSPLQSADFEQRHSISPHSLFPLREPPQRPMKLCAPPTGDVYTSLEDLVTALSQFTATQGYAVVKGGRKVDMDKKPRKCWLKCDMSGKFKEVVGEDKRKRQRTSRKTDCKWLGAACRCKEDGLWRLQMRDCSHNHLPTEADAHPTQRKFTREDLSQIAIETGRRLPVHKTAAELRRIDPTRPANMRDIYNVRASLRDARLEGRTRLEALFDELDQEEWSWAYYAPNSDDVLEGLMFFHHKSEALLKSYNYVFFLDTTHKTNRYNMPLLIITSTTACNKTFYIGFAFLRKETEEWFTWAMDIFRKILVNQQALDEDELIYPEEDVGRGKVFLTDGDDGLIAAIENVFPRAAHIQCQWHMHKNINSRVDKVFAGDPEGAQLWRSVWYRVLEASSEMQFIQADDELQEIEQVDWEEELYSYIYREYLAGNKKTKIVAYWINRVSHFGKKATSTSESGHWKLKRRLATSTGD